VIFIRSAVVFLIILASAAVFVLPKSSSSFSTANIQGDKQTQSVLSDKPYPQVTQSWQNPPAVSARSAIALDAETGIVLYQKDPTVRLLPASTTKLMTALVARLNCSPEEIVTVKNLEKEPTQMGLEIGDTVSVESLLYGLLIASGNDAAYALANFCAPSVNEFVNQMNRLAKRLGMDNSHFVNPAGFDDPAQFTTAQDLAKLAKVAVTDPLLSKIVATKSIVISDVTGVKTYYLENVNKLLGLVNGVEGVKTGKTEGSLENLITKTTRGEHTVITVVLGSADRFEDSKQLIEWAFANYDWNY
jgi:serine-type D-Ala-D-Ala carboxypeptidase (penicillin-binding protein 5/6)